MNEAHEQYSLLDAISHSIFYFESPGQHLYLSPKTNYMSTGETGRHGVVFFDLVIDIFLEVQNENYNARLSLRDYIADGFHL